MSDQQHVAVYRIAGRVIERASRQGVPRLRVEAWDKDFLHDDLVGSAETDAQGRFVIVFEDSYFRELFGDRRPDLFFRVFDSNRLIASTEDSILWNVGAGERSVEIEVEARQPTNGDGAVPGEPFPRALSLHGRLLTVETKQPLAGYRVHGFELSGDQDKVDIGFELSDPAGFFSLAYPRRAPMGTGDGALRRFALQVWSPAGAKIHETEVSVRSGATDVIEVSVSLPANTEPQSPRLTELAATVGLEIPEQLLAALEEREIRTLADIRRSGGLVRFNNLPVPPDHPAVAALDAHANLNLLSGDVRVNARLIERDYRSVSEVAASTRAVFVSSMQETLGDARAYQLHTGALAQARFAGNLAATLAVENVNGWTASLDIPELNDVFRPPCACKECEAAVSPLAYLSDLLDYAIGHLQENGAIDLQDLTDRFYQPFGRLPAACDALDQQVRQARICIEVLRRYLADNPPGAAAQATLAAAERGYRRAAYYRLLREIGTSYEQLRDARAASPEERAQRAEQIGIAPNRMNALFLDPTAVPETVTEAALETLFGLVSTALARDPLAAPQQAQLVTWRLERLGSVWRSEDAPEDAPARGRPWIDPDVIGPDDFRSPVAKANAADPDRPFDIWLQRRRWVDDRLDQLAALTHQVRQQQAPDFTAMLQAVWQPPLLARFPQLARDLTNGMRDEVEAARQSLANDMQLTIDAFSRLLELQAKDQLWQSHLANPTVSPEEWREVRSILVQTMKSRLFQQWRNEELQAEQQARAALGAQEFWFGPQEFWFSEHEPEEGDWPPERQPPLIDPERVGPRDLPEPVAGTRAINLWRARRSELDRVTRRLRTVREAQGLHAALVQALGNPIDPADPNALPDLSDLQRRLNDADRQVAVATRVEVETRLRMSVAAFNRVMEIRAKDAAANAPGVATPPSPPSRSEWEEVYTILTTAEKEYRLYAPWRDEERNPPPPQAPLDYWFALKAKLPRWRADAETRAEWRQALRVRYARPLIDPDVIGPGDFVRPRRGQAAYDLWRTRNPELDNLQTDLRQTRAGAANLLAGFEAICQRTLGHGSQLFLDLDARQRDGQSIAARMDQMSLTRREFAHLLSLRRLIDNGGPILEAEWSDAEAALTKVYKRRRTALWRQQERQANITLKPALFLVLQDDPIVVSEPQPGSRKDLVARREWQEILVSRSDQRQAVFDAQAQTISNVEGALLPMLRDALISATNPPGAIGNTIDGKGKRLTDLLLIDTRAGGCQITTRISQAISTIQGVLWSVRTGQLRDRDTYPNLALDDDDFDERWRWLGSYATWRAAMFVHLYPENILTPSLRRTMTSGFREFLKEARQQRQRINPESACEIAQVYADYYRDIVTLEVQASCHADTQMSSGTCRARTQGGRRVLAYWFGRASESGRCNWSSCDVTDLSSQSLWAPIPGLEKTSALLGAVKFRARDRTEMVLLFAMVDKEGADQLLLARYDLSAQRWMGSPIELDGPEEATSFTAVVNQYRIWSDPTISPQNAPRVIFQTQRAEGNILYEKRLNAEGEAWDDENWTPLDNVPYQRSVLAAVPVYATETLPYYVFFQDYGYMGTLSYRIYGSEIYPQRHYFDGAVGNSEGQLLGAFLWPWADHVFALWRRRTDGTTRVLRLLPPYALPYDPVADLDQFNQWLNQVANVDLRQISIGVLQISLSGVSNLLDFLNLPQNNPLRANDAVYQQFAAMSIAFFQNYIDGHLAIGSSEVALQLLATWQLADRIVNANAQPQLGIADCVRRLFNNRFPNLPQQPLSMRRLAQAPAVSTASLSNIESLAVDGGMPDLLDVNRITLAYNRLWQNVLQGLQEQEVVRGTFVPDPGNNGLAVGDIARIAPTELSDPPRPKLTAAWPGATQEERRLRLAILYGDHLGHPTSNLAYLDEYYYFVPVQIAMELQRNGHYVSALDWYRSVYDYTEPQGPARKVWYGLTHEESLGNLFTRRDDWLLDPLNPHAIAQTRRNSYTRFTLLSLIRCFLEYADDEFTQDTAETLERARTLYLTALELLDSNDLRQQLDRCEELIGSIDVRLSDPSYRPVFEGLVATLSGIRDLPVLRSAVADVEAVLGGDEADDVRLAGAQDIVDAALAGQPASPTFARLSAERSGRWAAVHTALLANERVAQALEGIGAVAANDSLHALSLVSGLAPDVLTQPATQVPWLRERVAGVGGNGLAANVFLGGNRALAASPQYRLAQLSSSRRIGFVYDPGFAYQFCIPPNPIVSALKLHAELNLYKMRHCRNIAGLERQVEPYAAATDTTTGLPTIGAGGQLVVPGILTLRPTPYRYEALISRAKELVQLSAQIEASMLAAIEKRDAELYSQLKARQDIRLTVAGVRVQELRLREAEDGVELAELQRVRAEFQVDHFEELLETPYSTLEIASLLLLGLAAATYTVASIAAIVEAWGLTTKEAWGFSAQAFQTTSSLLSQIASYERRREEWEFQRDLSQFDVRISGQQVQIAQDQVRVVGQERTIAKMQADHAKDTAEFLMNKFTNADLYDWMSNVLEEVYGFFLQQATATAKLAMAQLAFERQEAPPPFIQDDYWEAPGEGFGGDATGSPPDRRGLTGAARLLQDIQQFDQFAFETRQRKLELSRTISLARLSPMEFERFRQTGVMTFATPMEMFDRDFPGHYLRQIKRVRVSVIALVPPLYGIRATLTSSRLSRVVVGGDLFQTVRVQRGPEQVALTSAQNASGVLELEPQSELLHPFEGIGVDTFWEFRMPKAANAFDYSTIADVLMTIDYTALNSFDYREQVIRALPARLSADRPFSFRHQFADQWYDLHNPDQTATPMIVRFTTRRDDYPPNVEHLRIQHVVLYFARRAGQLFEVPVTHLRFTEEESTGAVGGGATSVDGVIGTRRGNAGSWTAMIGKHPFGAWELALPNTDEMKRRFKEEEIEDILFVITYSGLTPEWPA